MRSQRVRTRPEVGRKRRSNSRPRSTVPTIESSGIVCWPRRRSPRRPRAFNDLLEGQDHVHVARLAAQACGELRERVGGGARARSRTGRRTAAFRCRAAAFPQDNHAPGPEAQARIRSQRRSVIRRSLRVALPAASTAVTVTVRAAPRRVRAAMVRRHGFAVQLQRCGCSHPAGAARPARRPCRARRAAHAQRDRRRAGGGPPSTRSAGGVLVAHVVGGPAGAGHELRPRRRGRAGSRRGSRGAGRSTSAIQSP